MDLIATWSCADWLVLERYVRSDFRLLESMLLQVDEGLLARSAAERLGFNSSEGFLAIPAAACLWPRVSTGGGRVGTRVIEAVEAGMPDAQRAECPVDLDALRREAYAGALAC